MDKDMDSKPAESTDGSAGFFLLDEAAAGKTLTVRDDQADFSWLLDAVRLCRKKGGRFRLVDSGAYETARMEWLAEAGADVYTSDDTGRTGEALQSIALAGRKSRSVTALFLNGPEPGSENEVSGGEPASSIPLQNLILSGLTLHLSTLGSRGLRDFDSLVRLALSHRTNGNHMVCYHPGALSEDLVRLADSGAWIHLTEKSLEELTDFILLRDVVKTSKKAGANCFFHFEKTVEASILRELRAAGAILFFQTPHSDFRSPVREFEDWAEDLNLDHRAYYLYPSFFP